MTRFELIDSPADCHYRLEENGQYGCGYYRSYAGARESPCPDSKKFPESCPLEELEEGGSDE
ncbi:hypothetical protein [Methanocalculus sp. MC3]